MVSPVLQRPSYHALPLSMPGYDEFISREEAILKDPPQAFTIIDLLHRASKTNRGIEIYRPNEASQRPQYQSYTDLLKQAQKDAQALHRITGIRQDSILLLHFDSQLDNIRWFWAATIAGYLPCISTPFTDDPNHRHNHIVHLKSLLEDPIALVNRQTKRQFAGSEHIQLVLVEDLEMCDMYTPAVPRNLRADELATLLLTSGSTGNAKAVCFTHYQMIAAIFGKTLHGNTSSEDIFLNWVSLDHAVSLIEIHLHAMLLGSQQVQINAKDLLVDPLFFLTLVHRHRVTVAFAPNFFLNLVHTKALDANSSLFSPQDFNLSSLKHLNCGGEACDTQTVVDFTELFRQSGNTYEFVHPGYGLTESCAGVILAHESPSSDVKKGLKYASVGKPIAGCQTQIVKDNGSPAGINEIGELYLKGPMIFSRYYNNPQATKDAFSADGWFKTGDQGYSDIDGQINLTGRSKELLIINGINYYPHQIELAIEQAYIAGVVPSFTVVFAHRPHGAHTESYCVLYGQSYADIDVRARVDTEDAISRVASSITKTQPFRVIPMPRAKYHKSSIGKVSRAKIKFAFESGEFDSIVRENRRLIHDFRVSHRKKPSTPTEEAIVAYVAEILSFNQDELSIDSNIFQLGFTSLDLFSMTMTLKQMLGLDFTPDLVSILRKPTIEEISRIIDEDSFAVKTYDPIVPLQTKGKKTPIFFIHPASGNILAFLQLAKYFHDRPVYGVRATGVKKGERLFSSFSEMASTYFESIRRTQPNGPYAVVGYSLGSSLAFEVAKQLEASGEEVRFVGVLDSPPDILPLVGHLTWSATLVMVSFFYGLITEKWSKVLLPKLWSSSPDEALDFVIGQAEPKRLESLQIDREGLSHVTDITSNFGRACKDYRPKGIVSSMDVFVVDPLECMARDRTQWKDEYLVNWKDFVRETNVKYHECDGTHADMLTEQYVHSFQRKLKTALSDRGI